MGGSDGKSTAPAGSGGGGASGDGRLTLSRSLVGDATSNTAAAAASPEPVSAFLILSPKLVTVCGGTNESEKVVITAVVDLLSLTDLDKPTLLLEVFCWIVAS
jgi:hypothetical protein